MKQILYHLRTYWTQHSSAVGGSLFGLINGVGLAQSIAAGVSIYIITNALGMLWKKITNR